MYEIIGDKSWYEIARQHQKKIDEKYLKYKSNASNYSKRNDTHTQGEIAEIAFCKLIGIEKEYRYDMIGGDGHVDFDVNGVTIDIKSTNLDYAKNVLCTYGNPKDIGKMADWVIQTYVYEEMGNPVVRFVGCIDKDTFMRNAESSNITGKFGKNTLYVNYKHLLPLDVMLKAIGKTVKNV